jgi:hypothetical protein
MFSAQDRFLALLASCYGHAPHFTEVMALVRRVLDHDDRRVAQLVHRSISEILAYIGLERCITFASELKISPDIRRERRILEICRAKNAIIYVNPCGGRELYDVETFAKDGVELRFLRSEKISYLQFGAPFVPSLSIIDVLMFNAPTTVRTFTEQFELEAP